MGKENYRGLAKSLKGNTVNLKLSAATFVQNSRGRCDVYSSNMKSLFLKITKFTNSTQNKLPKQVV